MKNCVSNASQEFTDFFSRVVRWLWKTFDKLLDIFLDFLMRLVELTLAVMNLIFQVICFLLDLCIEAIQTFANVFRGIVNVVSSITCEEIEDFASACIVVLLWIGAFRIIRNLFYGVGSSTGRNEEGMSIGAQKYLFLKVFTTGMKCELNLPLGVVECDQCNLCLSLLTLHSPESERDVYRNICSSEFIQGELRSLYLSSDGFVFNIWFILQRTVLRKTFVPVYNGRVWRKNQNPGINMSRLFGHQRAANNKNKLEVVKLGQRVCPPRKRTGRRTNRRNMKRAQADFIDEELDD
ncbi:uncharacterized protein LOC143150383 [Ptiloglossa arizonensis]|uniref:uncharacterized protein LOC143150383 n=1 Tax=Ptiloglossa arizonensis TaxID=3350558 RepID=UPI003FA083FA